MKKLIVALAVLVAAIAGASWESKHSTHAQPSAASWES